MSEPQAYQGFIDTILAEPEVESHRLIFADWLEENGDLNKAEGLRTLPGLAGVWSYDWGQDEHGIWCSFTIQDVSQTMRWIPPGTFFMGSPQDEHGRFEREGPCHEVVISQGFWMASTPCTLRMWRAVMGDRPLHEPDTMPVMSVSWEEAQSFLLRCNDQIHGLTLALPTQAQWEYACRSGTEGARYHEDPDVIAWTSENSGSMLHPVGGKLPNAWGLYDTLGHVWEWCFDGMGTYSEEKVTDPIGLTEIVNYRAIRGGSYDWDARHARAASRFEAPRNYRGGPLSFRVCHAG